MRLKHLTSRKLKNGRTLYYYQRYGKKIPIGDNLQQAHAEWSKRESGVTSNLFPGVADRYKTTVLPKKAFKTQKEQEKQLERLMAAFASFPLDSIAPHHVRAYIDKRTRPIAANREVALLSHLWNWAREKGITSLANPCSGISRNKEHPRRVYVRNDSYQKVYDAGVFWLQDAMDLILDSGQRPSDVLAATKHDLHEGFLEYTQSKTGTKIRVEIMGTLKETVERILSRQRKVASIYLVADANGQKISIWRLDKEFARTRDKVGEKWQIRDLRKKSATDENDLRIAQERLGHADETTTARIYRQLRWNKVKPLR